MSNSIQFLDTWGNTPAEFAPTPSAKVMPEWYRHLETYAGGVQIADYTKQVNDEFKCAPKTATVKKCASFFDAMTAGYILKLPTDLRVSIRDGAPFYEWPERQLILWHSHDQMPNYPGREHKQIPHPKINHPWGIRTPAGYSTLFINPTHRESPFRILEGMVDTDVFHAPVLFPFMLKQEGFEGIVPAGTPIAQAIPVKRETWDSEIVDEPLANFMATRSQRKIHSLFNGGYRRFFWSRKEYR